MNLSVSSALTCMALAGALSTGLAAQNFDRSELRVPIHTSDADPVGGAYGTWAAGKNYKASFHGGMTFVPYAGMDVATNRELSWRTTAVRVGGTELTNGRSHARRAGDFRYEYDLGGVIEAYDVLAEGLHQTFVIADRPTIAGDLVVRGSIGGNLTTTNRSAAHGPVTFFDDAGVATVTYGHAIAIDGNGDVAEMTTAVENGQIELRLPGQWLEQATFPIVVDPVLSNELLELVPIAQDVDIYRDGEQITRNVWVIYSSAASASDIDIFGVRYDDGFSGLGVPVFNDLTSSWNSQHGQIAGVGGSGAGKTITVFERDFASGDRRVRWHTHGKSDLSLRTGVSSVPYQAGTSDWRPDVGGTRSSVPGTVALLVFQREPAAPFQETAHSQVVGLKIDTAISSNGAPVGSVFGFGAVSPDEERPAVNQTSEGGVQFSWVVVWQQHDNSSTGKWNVIVQRTPGAFGGFSYARHIDNSNLHEVGPDVAGADGRYLVTYGHNQSPLNKPTGIRSTYIRARRIDWPHNAVHASFPAPSRSLYGGTLAGQIPGSVAYDLESRSHWVTTYATTNAGSEKLLMSKVGYDGNWTEHVVLYDVPGFQPIPGGVSYDEDNERFAVAFHVDNNTSTNLLMGNYVTYEQMSTSIYGTACHPTANISWFGDHALGFEFGRVQVAQAPAYTSAFLVASLGGASTSLQPFGMPGCTLLVDVNPPMHLATAFFVTSVVGRAAMDLPIPGFLPPADLHFQWALLEPGVNPTGMRTTRGLRVQARR